ncbi:MAG: tetratricopeptide repeat protein [Campylobacterota bacterium]|nr:tetratricopeptide repeat protein [Campylobacterota bacterium]
MIKIKNSILSISILFYLSGCSLPQQITGEYYLQQQKYKNGIEFFQQKISQDDQDSTSYYYLGRFLLAKNKTKEAIPYLEKAIKLDNSKSNYYSWLGVSYGTLDLYKEEMKAYKKALLLDKKNIQALTYLAHNYFDSNLYIKALNYYNKVLKISPQNQTSLYNRALILGKLERTPEQLQAYKEYLSYYPFGTLARKSVTQINKIGNFDYENLSLAYQNTTIKSIKFKPLSTDIDINSKESLNIIGNILSKNKKINLHIISYQLNNKKLAKEKVKKIKTYLLKRFKTIDPYRLKLSWFDNPKIKKFGNNKYILNEYIQFIAEVN